MKKSIAIVVGIVLLLVIAGYAGFMWWTWSQYSETGTPTNTQGQQAQNAPPSQEPPQTPPANQPGQPDNQPPTDQKTFEAAGKFSISYPKTYQANSGSGLGGANLDTSYVSIALPDGLFSTSGTNYVESYIVISSSTSSDSLKNCTSFQDVNQDPEMKVTTMSIGGVNFSSTETGDAAAGNLYNSKLYRTVYEGACYEAALVVHTGNIGNYDPGVTEFDQTQALDRLMSVLQTFKFE